MSLSIPAFVWPSLAAMLRHAAHRLAQYREGFMRRRILAVTIAAALLGVVAAPAGARNSESAPESKPKPKTPGGGTVYGEGDKPAQRQSRRAGGGRERLG